MTTKEIMDYATTHEQHRETFLHPEYDFITRFLFRNIGSEIDPVSDPEQIQFLGEPKYPFISPSFS
jgi:hypothetical protein